MRYLANSLLLLLALLTQAACSAANESKGTVEKNEPTTASVAEDLETAVVGAGCFWCVEVFFESLEGVQEVYSGYAGGSEPNPTYKQVARGRSTHAEVVEIVYDPEVVSYRELIDFFWTTHDATRADGVWPDFGPQYRSTILYKDAAQQTAALESKRQYEAAQGIKIATAIEPLDKFYLAEGYHQDYAKKNPKDRYVTNILNPKLKKLGIQ